MGKLQQQREQCWLPGKTKVPHCLDKEGNWVLFLASHHCVTLPHPCIELQIDSSEL